MARRSIIECHEWLPSDIEWCTDLAYRMHHVTCHRYRRAEHPLKTLQGNYSGVIGQNVCPFWLVFLCGGGRSSCSSCMGGELEVGQNVCPEWPVRPCGTTVE